MRGSRRLTADDGSGVPFLAFPGMTHQDHTFAHTSTFAPGACTSVSGAPERPQRPHPRAPLVLGLGLLPLTVGLTRIVGLPDLLGPAGGPAALVALVTVAWVAIVGWGRVPRPVATLTLAGVAAAAYIAVFGAVVLLMRGEASPVMLVGLVPIFAIQTAWGFLSGLLALGVQRLGEARR